MGKIKLLTLAATLLAISLCPHHVAEAKEAPRTPSKAELQIRYKRLIAIHDLNRNGKIDKQEINPQTLTMGLTLEALRDQLEYIGKAKKGMRKSLRFKCRCKRDSPQKPENPFSDLLCACGCNSCKK
jgi:hypothetical protein